LGPGAIGEGVRDVQRRLLALGFDTQGDDAGAYGAATETAVRAFQRRRGLREDGRCGHQTWAALVEAGYELGDRMVYRSARMLRGDDVAELQRRLSALGFDTGKVDGIFGDQTEHGLVEFQRNAGLTVDGICGPATVRALRQLGERGQPVAAVREREALRSRPPTLAGRKVAIAQQGGLDALVRAVERELTSRGGEVAVLHHPDGAELAAAANGVAAEVFVGLVLDVVVEGCTTAYYEGLGGASPGGRRLAELMQCALPATLDVKDRGARGMSLPVLRETRMPAVLCELGPASVVVERGAEVAVAVREALAAWVSDPLDLSS
jgi:N-acetylmuramoyl-L-alanine amidase